ncbi:dihydroorotase [Thermococcus guaymasensis DSM 11113]|uniref:Dihydroorotase n=1 Tax=Thermococcus guaymasensis DSM 11113 TaxID=1432656 RepID=A0A0X1KK83_9EURY|nr:dihydroorotase [Thermococcus guaymasensis]AJC71681.1 dihydroorotase [Thermococcus guaymasensis DSM 11113]
MHELVLKGKFVFGGKLIHGSVGIDGGIISAITTHEIPGGRKINLSRYLILPGLIDTHVHLRDLKEKRKETVESGTKAALHGGITAVFDMPNTKPPVIDSKTFQKRLELFQKRAYADYAIGFLIKGNCEEAKKVRADFYKSFMGASTGGIYSDNFEGDYACSPGVLSVHAEDAKVIKENPERPPEAEVRAINRALDAAEKLKKPLNICHVSTAGGTEAILNRSLPWVSFEVTPHHLFLTKRDYERNPLFKVYPPLRDEEHRKVLWENFPRIPIIASDHAPHTLEDKEVGAAGIPGLETEVALLLDAVNRRLMSIFDIVEKMHDNPVRVFGIKERDFAVGNDATFTIVDLKREWKVKPEEFYTKAKWSPWEGRKLKGKVVMTVLRGKVVMEEDEVIGKPEGVRLYVQGG